MKILLADMVRGRADALAAQLRAQDPVAAIDYVRPDENLVAAVRRTYPDVVVVDMARPDRDSLDSVRSLHIEAPSPVVMFIDQDDQAFMEEAIAAGVTSYFVVGTSLPEIKPILRVAIAFFRRARELDAKLVEAEAKLASRATIDQAKRLLMTRDGMSEPAAHRWLQRLAMKQQKKLVEIAENFLVERGASGARGKI